MNKPIIIPLWQFAIMLWAFGYLFCRNIKSKYMDNKAVDLFFSFIITATIIIVEYFS